MAARPAPRTVIAPALDCLAGSAEAAKPAEEEPIHDQRDRDPDPGPHGPASVAGRGTRLAAFGRRQGAARFVPHHLSQAPASRRDWLAGDRGGSVISALSSGHQARRLLVELRHTYGGLTPLNSNYTHHATVPRIA